jgi:hypothetical protein
VVNRIESNQDVKNQVSDFSFILEPDGAQKNLLIVSLTCFPLVLQILMARTRSNIKLEFAVVNLVINAKRNITKKPNLIFSLTSRKLISTLSSGSAYRIRTGDLLLEREVSLTPRRMRHIKTRFLP